MPDERKLTMLTTVDADIHVLNEDIDLARMKIDYNKWLMTIDGRYVRSDKVVCVWVPDVDELRGFMEGVNVLAERTE